MDELWRHIKKPLARGPRHITGEMSLEEVIKNVSFKNNLDGTDLSADQKQKVVGLIEIVGRVISSPKNVSMLRTNLLNNPKKLGLNDDETRIVLALFIDTRQAVEYK
jgi:hypothetical protein